MEALWQAFKHLYYSDKANAAMHMAEVRFSPVTFAVCEYMHTHGWDMTLFPESNEVLRHKGQYELDKGR